MGSREETGAPVEQEIRLDANVDDLLELEPIQPVAIEERVEDAPAVEPIGDLDHLTGGLLSASRWQLATKRAMDIVGGALLILLLSPVLISVALAVKLTSRGPVFYVQRRVGRLGEPFRMLKFRSMQRDAESHKLEHTERNIHNGDGPIFKIPDDPRRTAVGRVIRRYSIDELPQLFNVLWGQMSLVGPRPHLPEEFVHYGPKDRGRLLVKPGLTCIWQVSGRSDLDFGTWVDMDLEYIRTWTLRKDVVLLVKTVPAVLSGRGAY
jgi:lipopolysaccharide/colanic/teichoic acid biosynthesis glycosyltransferase